MSLLTNHKLADFLKKSSTVRRLRREYLKLTKPRNFDGYNKVFCIGWLKTGTSSFGHAMRHLGYKHCGWDEDIWNWYKEGKIDKIIEYARYFESFDDLPWNKLKLLEKLDLNFPNSKFVLLERDSESWYKSYKKHLKKNSLADPHNKAVTIKKFEERNKLIKDYFKGHKSSQLLIMDITDGDGYERLCPFLDLPVRDELFPHANKSD